MRAPQCVITETVSDLLNSEYKISTKLWENILKRCLGFLLGTIINLQVQVVQMKLNFIIPPTGIRTH